MTVAKICGVCRPEDAAQALAAGAEYIGVILAPGQRRTRTPDEAAAIYEAAPAARRVGVFVDADADEIEASVAALALDVVQLHGSEPPELAAGLRRSGLAVWKAVRPRNRLELESAVASYAAVVDGLLLDGWSDAAPGGSGTPAPWAELGDARALLPAGVQLIAAGGLAPENVAGLVLALRPDVADVSSGVERSPGEKDPDRVAAFVAAVRLADAQQRIGAAGDEGSAG